MSRAGQRSGHYSHAHPDSELYLFPVEPIQNRSGSVVLKEMKDRQMSYMKNDWFQHDFRLPLKLVDYVLCLLDEVSLGIEMESIVKHGAILLLVRINNCSSVSVLWFVETVYCSVSGA